MIIKLSENIIEVLDTLLNKYKNVFTEKEQIEAVLDLITQSYKKGHKDGEEDACKNIYGE